MLHFSILRILFLTHRLPYAPNRGDRIRAHHLLRLLASRHEVHLVSLLHDREEQQRLVDVAGIAASADGALVPRLQNHIAAVAALSGSRPLTHVLLSSPEFSRVIQRTIEAAPPDVVLAYCTGVAEAILRPPLDTIPCVLDMVDVDSEKWSDLAATARVPMKWIYQREARLLRAFERTVSQRVRAVTVVSERERTIAERDGISNVVVSECGADLAGLTPPAGIVKRCTVAFTGVFNYPPNEAAAVWFASEVWPLVKKNVPDAVLMLVGMNPTRRVRALSKTGSIYVTGAVPDVKPYLWESSVAIAPVWLSRGTQTKVLEALAAGLPCVITPAVRAGLPQAAQSACVCRDDAVGFADAVTSLLQQPPGVTERAAIETAARSLDWPTQLTPFLRLIEDVGRSTVARI